MERGTQKQYRWAELHEPPRMPGNLAFVKWSWALLFTENLHSGNSTEIHLLPVPSIGPMRRNFITAASTRLRLTATKLGPSDSKQTTRCGCGCKTSRTKAETRRARHNLGDTSTIPLSYWVPVCPPLYPLPAWFMTAIRRACPVLSRLYPEEFVSPLYNFSGLMNDSLSKSCSRNYTVCSCFADWF